MNKKELFLALAAGEDAVVVGGVFVKAAAHLFEANTKTEEGLRPSCSTHPGGEAGGGEL